jgi:YVTN family beta-propeller protein
MSSYITRALGTFAVIGGLAVTAVTVPAQAGTPAVPTAARSPGAATAYVCNWGGNHVTAISTVTNKVIKAIKVGAYPSTMVITPNGATAYVETRQGVVPVNTATFQVGQVIKGTTSATVLAVTPDGRTVYAMTWNKVVPISTATNKAGPAIKIKNPAAIAITPNSRTAYVARYSGLVTPISTATNTTGKPIRFARGFVASGVFMVITPNGKTAYVASDRTNGKGSMLLSTVVPIRIATNKPGKPITVGRMPTSLVITPNGKTLLVGTTGQSGVACRQGACTGRSAITDTARVTLIRTATNTALKAIKLGPMSKVTLGVTPDSRTAYALYTRYVIPIRTATNKALKPIKLGVNLEAIAITPNSKTAYVARARYGKGGRALLGVVVPISTATNKAGTAIQVGRAPGYIAMTP